MSHSFQIASLTPGLLPPSLAIATYRAGGLGILDFEHTLDDAAAEAAIRKLSEILRGDFGVQVSGIRGELLQRLVEKLPAFLKTVIVSGGEPGNWEERVRSLREQGVFVLLEATNLQIARKGEAAGFQGLVAKGHEAGGRVDDETTFILLQRFQAEVHLPVWARGGIGLHTAAACAAAGASGLILDSQLLLTRESSFPEAVKARVATMDGSETLCLGEHLGESYRVYFRPGSAVVKELQGIEAAFAQEERPSQESLQQWRQAISQKAGWASDQSLWLLGQDAAFAAPLAKKFRTVGGVLQALREAVRTHTAAAERLQPLAEDSPLARSHGTRYPILQGPMTRVSDVPEFAAHVAEGGALPFLALALMRGPEVRTLLETAQRRMGAMPWGVGVLGFVPQELRQEQMEVVREFKPPFALIAGGRPDQASALEKQGISTYLHVPSPGLLKMFVSQGARRFVFEGRECGGHVGPRTSFVLWNQMIDVLLEAAELDIKPEEFHIVFAAGIHDAMSAAMVSVLAAPLAERGVQIGVLLGSAYLFTKEVVASGAILSTFQEQAKNCSQTVLLETGPGHSTRCVVTPFASSFFQEKRRLVASGRPAEEIRMTLEDLNLGRLRMASKGLTRNSAYGEDPKAAKLTQMDVEQQLAQGMYMIGQVAALRNSICTVKELHYNVAVEGSNRLQGLGARFGQPAPTRRETPSDVAVVGMSCLLPKAPDLVKYWENILNRVDAITEVPPERWNPETYYDPDPKAKDKIYSKWGGFLDDVAFDPMQYGMPPATLRSIEPAQLLTLEVVRAALEDSGYLDRPFPRERTSVILGAGGGAADLGLAYGARSFIPNLENLPEFQGRSQEILERMGARLPEWTEDSFAGILTNVAAGRVANRFDLGGSNYTVDAACASSLAAVSLALKELEGHTSDMVIVGGIDTMQNPFTYLCFSKTHALSPRGRCRTFDESADGIAISEGIAVLVFKRLEDAERDGDRIYAVIKGAGSSSDGKDRGLTAPRPEGQAKALRRAYSKAGFSPATVGLVEAHGTGTVAGDGAEVQALTQVFSEFEAERQGCAIGSVKSMIGHTKCSAGAAGLIKTALALHHKVLPPTLGVEKPNPRARFPESPFFVNTEARPWLANASGNPRRAGVSAFGFGGTNFHVVMEEYTGDASSPRAAAYQQWSDELFVFKGESRQALAQSIQTWEAALSKAGAGPLLRDLAYTAWKQAEDKSAKTKEPLLALAVIASSLDDLRQKLASARQNLAQVNQSQLSDPRGVYFSEQPLGAGAKIAFLFPGQGSQYPHMLQDLLLHFPEMQAVFEQASHALRGALPLPLSSYVFPPSSFTPDEAKARQRALTETNVAQPALGAAGMAMFGLLHQLGLKPDMLAGHSYGEYVALAAAGVFDLDTLIAVSEARGRFIVRSAEGELGTMAAVEADSAQVASVLAGAPDVCIANANSPRQTVISGTRVAVEGAAQKFTAQGTAVRLIPVACAFHSPLVAPSQQPLAEFLSTVKMAEPSIPVYSNTTASVYPKDAGAIAEQLVAHLVRSVEFAGEIEAMYAAGARVFVEVGPRGVLTGLVDRTLEDRPKLAVASNQSGKPGLTQLLHLLGQLSAQGVSLKLDRLFAGRSVQRLNLAALPSGEKPLAASAWLVNGARAKPAKEAAAVPARLEAKSKPPVNIPNLTVPNLSVPNLSAPKPLVAAAGKASAPNGFHHEPAAASPAVPRVPIAAPLSAPVTLPAPLPIVTPDSATLEGVPQVMAQFQQMMTRFLEAQQTVMLSYLGAESSSVSVPVAAPTQPVFAIQAPVLHVAAPQAPIVQAPPFPIAVPAHQPAFIPVETKPAGPDLSVLTAQLLDIVGDRTGYPAEMLGLDLDLEADLGIDSIKRVEILGTFQQSFASSGTVLGEGLIENLSGVRTLQGIVDKVAEQLRGVAVPEPVIGNIATDLPLKAISLPAVAPVPTPEIPVPGLTAPELTARLLAIVSDRTGYPAEMLGLDLDLEADLGIDSIKRVEILGTFQQSFAGQGIALGDGLIEKLNGVRTLNGIVERVVEQLVAPAPGHSVSTPSPGTPSFNTPAPAAFDPQEITTRLLAIVSDRTGYPAEMLGLDLDLEADLGIDSIKRVEVLGTFQQSLIASGITVDEGLLEQLAGVRSLRGILDRVAGSAASTPVIAALQTAAAVVDDQVPEGAQIHRFTLATVEAPAKGSWKGVAKDRTILVTDDGTGVARLVADRFQAQGYAVAFVQHQEDRDQKGVREPNPGTYLADLGSAEGSAELIALINSKQGLLGGIVHLLPLAPVATSSLGFGTKSLFYLARAASHQLQESAVGGACLIAATGMGGAFLNDWAPGGTLPSPGQGGVVGLAKTLALEWPGVRVKAIDLNVKETASALAEHLFREIHAGDGQVEVGINQNRRVILQPKIAPVAAQEKPLIALDRSSVILITGGARGIAARTAQHLAELYQPTILLAGRSPLPKPEESAETASLTSAKELKLALMERLRAASEPVTPARVEQAYLRLTAEREVRANLAALRQLGARVHYYSVDVRDPALFGAFIHQIYTEFGHLDGVIHAAGIIEDKLVQDKTTESFDRVFDTKVDSAFTLSQTIRPEGLKFLVFFSSVSGRFGNRGQGDYAAANEVLNKMAVCLDAQWPARVVALNWGPWDSGGMVSAEVRKQFAERGVVLIPPAVGLRYLEEELLFGAKGDAEVVIGGAGWHAAEPTATQPASWPLLFEGTVSETDGTHEFLREIDVAHDLYLEDHQLDGQPVLPLAVATELMAEVVAQGWPHMQVAAVRDLRLLNGIVLDRGPKTVRIAAKPKGDNLITVEITSAAKPYRIHYRSTVELAHELPGAAVPEPPPFTDGAAFPMEVARTYQEWLFHGPLLQGIVRVDLVGPSGMRATLATSAPADLLAGRPQGQWLIDPLLFDSALQLLVLWGRVHWDMTALPSGFERYRRFAAPSSAHVVCELRIRANTGGQNIHADLYFLDAGTGQLLAILEDMQGACSKALNRLAKGEALVPAGSRS